VAFVAAIHVYGQFELFHFERVLAADEQGAFDGVAKLADVAGPGLVLQPAFGRVAKPQLRTTLDLREVVEEVLRDERNVGGAFAQAGQVDGDWGSDDDENNNGRRDHQGGQRRTTQDSRSTE
jgi:hypothetical protein